MTDLERIETINQLCKGSEVPTSLGRYLIIHGHDVDFAKKAVGAYVKDGCYSHGSSRWCEPKSAQEAPQEQLIESPTQSPNEPEEAPQEPSEAPEVSPKGKAKRKR